MSTIMKLLQDGCPNDAGFKILNLDKEEIMLIELGIVRVEKVMIHRQMTVSEREIYYSAFFSACSVCGEILKAGRKAN